MESIVSRIYIYIYLSIVHAFAIFLAYIFVNDSFSFLVTMVIEAEGNGGQNI